MTKSSPEYLNLADNLLRQFSQTQEDSLSAVLTSDNLEAFSGAESGENLDMASPESWRWHNRRVVITDGSTLSMPDTIENQQAYPQHRGQKKRVGNPILRIEILSAPGVCRTYAFEHEIQ